jgi:hypothetical protein
VKGEEETNTCCFFICSEFRPKKTKTGSKTKRGRERKKTERGRERIKERIKLSLNHG